MGTGLVDAAQAQLSVSSAKPATNILQKCCVYDPDALMAQSAEWNEIMMGLDGEYQKRAADLQKDQENLRADAGKMQAKKGVVADAALEAEQVALMRKGRDLEVRATQMQEDYKMERQGITMKFVKKLEEQVKDFGVSNSYDLVFPKSMGVYASAAADQTRGIVDFMNKKYEGEKKSKKAEATSLKLASADLPKKK